MPWPAPACCCATCMRRRCASGQFYPPDPTETGASIGGNIACNASGSRSFRYGATRAWVERLRVVLADGRMLDIGRGEPIDFDPGTVPLPAVTKNTAGYLLRPGMDWVDLFIGSEGTLGVVTASHAAAACRRPRRCSRAWCFSRATIRR